MYEEIIKIMRQQCQDMACGNCKTCVVSKAANAIKELNQKVEELEAMREISPEAEYAINKHTNSLISKLDELISGSGDKPRWFSVTEPPKYGDYYLVCDNCGRVYTAPFGNTGWWLESNITHWMPLPKPPKD